MDGNSSSVPAPRPSVQALRRSIAVVAVIAACVGASAVVDVVTAWTHLRSSSSSSIETDDWKQRADAQQLPDSSATEKMGVPVPSNYAGMPTSFHAVSIGEVFARAPR